MKIVQDADAIFREEVAKAGLNYDINQYFAALTNMRSVGVMGDFRTYDYAVVLRAVTTIDFMSAEAAQLPWELLEKVMNRIINEVDHVNRVLYDCTSKPPGTIFFASSSKTRINSSPMIFRLLSGSVTPLSFSRTRFERLDLN